jgi:glycosyltransferase involved in cell wall biosynthesis
MKVCVTRSLRSGYTETFIRNQIHGLANYAEVVPVHSGRLPERTENDKLIGSYLFWILHQVTKGITGKRNNFFSNYTLKNFLKKNNIDVVLANYGLSGSHLAPICTEAAVPLVVIFHGYDATLKKVISKYSSLYKQLFRQASAIVAVSSEMKTRLVQLGASADKISVIPCGINVDKFLPAKEKNANPTFIAVGRFASKKAPHITIKAFHKVWLNHPSAHLVMIGGGGGLFDSCVTLANDLGLQNAVLFTGALKPDEVVKHMQKAHVFVQHSITAPNGDMEGTPNSILEAGACELPSVSTFHGGIKEAVVHERTGFLVAEGDVDAMAMYMQKLIEEPSMIDTMGKAARKHIKENYSLDGQIEKLYNVLRKAVEHYN